MTRSSFVASLSLALLAATTACGSDETSTPSTGKHRPPIGFNVLPINYDTSEAAWQKVLGAAGDAGVETVAFYGPIWRETETAPGVFDWGVDAGFFAAIASYDFPQRVLDLSTPVGWSREELPADMVFTSFSDPELVERYKGYLTRAITRFRQRLTHVILHTEQALVYFGIYPDRLAGYCSLIAEAADHIRATFPGLRVGAYQDDDPDKLRVPCLYQPMDFFTAPMTCDPKKPLSDIRAQLDRGFARAAGKPLAFNETSCATSSYIGSSEALQAQTVEELFDFADEHADIELVLYYSIFDEDKAVTRAWVDAQFPDWSQELRDSLVEWASSLGLRTYLDTPKQGWDAFRARVAGQP